VSQAADSSYKRLTRRIAVPAGGATVGFDLTRATEPGWDYAFVEAHTLGQDDWTTLRDVNGHTTRATGESCTGWPDLHPFISEHYQTVDQEAETCDPTGATGEWWAASGSSEGSERWRIDLTEYAGSTVELSIAYASDQLIQQAGLFVDDVKVSTGAGTTSFETGLDGWTVPGPPAGSPGNENDWIAGTADAIPPPPGEIAADALGRQPEIIGFLASVAGRYPWTSAGGIVDDVEELGFALDNQTRPIYSSLFFGDPVDADAVVVHELAHQWYGDSLALNAGATSGSMRGSRRTPSGSGRNARVSGRRRRSSTSSSATTSPPPTTSSGNSPSVTRDRTNCSTPRSTSAGR
jgi:hypothetical protein